MLLPKIASCEKDWLVQLHEKKQAWKDAKDKEDAENEQLKAKRTELDEQLAANERELEAQDRCMERVQAGRLLSI